MTTTLNGILKFKNENDCIIKESKKIDEVENAEKNMKFYEQRRKELIRSVQDYISLSKANRDYLKSKGCKIEDNDYKAIEYLFKSNPNGWKSIKKVNGLVIGAV